MILHDGRATIVDAQLTLFSRWGRERFTSSASYKGGHYFICDCLQPITLQITQDTRPTIVDARLTLIVMIGMGGYRNLFSLWRWPMIPLWLSATYRHSDYAGRMSKDRSHSVDSHFQDEAGSMSLWHSAINAANTLILYNHDQINFQLPDLHDLKLLTLRWRSFCHGCIHNIQLFDLV